MDEIIELRNVSFHYSGGEYGGNTGQSEEPDDSGKAASETTAESAETEGQSADYACLKDISLTIQRGETVVLAGESGCGKTTITRLINGLIPGYYEGDLEGKIFLDGQDTDELTLYDISTKVGSVFQNPRSQFFNVDTDSELAFCCENQGLPAEVIRERVDRTVREFRIAKLMHRSIFDLSGGEKQKIACASASVEDPEILVLDEPSSNLDMAATKDLTDCIARWKEQGKTIVIAEHRLQYLRNLADRVIYIRDGRAAREFTMRELEELSAAEMEELGLRPVSGAQFLQSVGPAGAESGGKSSHAEVGKNHSGHPAGNETAGADSGGTATEVQKSRNDVRRVRLRNFNFSYRNRVPVLRINDAVIPHDEVIAVIGYNGAGKSTFARCLCGLEKKCKGTAEMNGQVYGRKDRLKRTFMVMQDVNHQLFTESVREEILISMEEENEERADQILQSLDLLPYAERHPMSLSGGQKQRVAIGCAEASERDTIILDEPTSGLDLRHMHEVAEAIRRLSPGTADESGDSTVSAGKDDAGGSCGMPSEGHKCILVITHDLELILRCCTYVVRIESGEITEQYPLDNAGVSRVTDFFETPWRGGNQNEI